MRLHAETATIENGFAWLPEAAPWLADYLAELTAFPAGRHDDQVDSTAQALARTKQRRRSTCCCPSPSLSVKSRASCRPCPVY